MCDNPEMIEIPVNEYETLKHYKRLWEFYCSKGDFEIEGEYEEEDGELVADPSSEVIIYTNRTLREENDFLNTICPSDEECEEAELPCEDCSHCACGSQCCGESDFEIEVEKVEEDE